MAPDPSDPVVTDAPPSPPPGGNGNGTVGADGQAISGEDAGGAMGIIVAIVVVVLVLVVAAAYWWVRRQRAAKALIDNSEKLAKRLSTTARGMSCERLGQMAMIEAGRHSLPPTPAGPPPPPGTFALPTGRSGDVVLVRGTSTLDPAQQSDWATRRATIQRNLSKLNADADLSPDSPEPNAAAAAVSRALSGGELTARSVSPGQRSGSFHLPRPSGYGSPEQLVPHQGARPRGVSLTQKSTGGKPGVLGKMLRKSRSLIRIGSGENAAKAERRSSEARAELATRYEVSDHVKNVCKEIRGTEAIYITDLETCLAVYARPAAQQGVLSREDVLKIFSNLEELCRCAAVLLELMDLDGERVTRIALAFIQVTPFFKLYASYCRNYEIAMATIAACRKADPAFGTFLQEQSMDPRVRGMPLESFLIKPVQRLTKYPLFWKDLLKGVPHTHPDRATLEKASELVTTVSLAVNQTLTDELTRLKLYQMFESMGGAWMPVITPHRKLESEFTCTVHVGGLRTVSANGVLLSDLLLLLQKGRGNRQTPWLLAPLDRVCINQEVKLDDVSLTVQSPDRTRGRMMSLAVTPEDGAPAPAMGFSMPRPAGVPQARLLNLQVDPDEEYWLELPDETAAYALEELVSSLAVTASKHIEGGATEDTEQAVEDLANTLKAKRMKKNRGFRGSVASCRESTACRASTAVGSVPRASAMSNPRYPGLASTRPTEISTGTRSTDRSNSQESSSRGPPTPGQPRASVVTTWGI